VVMIEAGYLEMRGYVGRAMSVWFGGRSEGVGLWWSREVGRTCERAGGSSRGAMMATL
jgi:hypothetical protein